MSLLDSARLVMIGDSITEWGRPPRTAPDYATALGHGYVAKVDALLRARRPGLRLRVLNRGVGGNTVRDLAARWDRDVLGLQPDWLSVMIGINDAWRHFDPVPARAAEAVPPAEFEQTYDLLLALARPRLAGLVVLGPFVVERDRADPLRRRTEEFAAIAARLAVRHGAQWIDTQAVIDGMLARQPAAAIAADRVHVGEAGHAAIAAAFVAAVVPG